jgi:hypothetical protein
VRPERFELPTYCSGGNRSIQLSYGRVSASVHRERGTLNAGIQALGPKYGANLAFDRRHRSALALVRLQNLLP